MIEVGVCEGRLEGVKENDQQKKQRALEQQVSRELECDEIKIAE